MTLTHPDQPPVHLNFPAVRLNVIKVGQFFLVALFCVLIGILLCTGSIHEIVPAPVPVKKGVTPGSVRMDQRCQTQWKHLSQLQLVQIHLCGSGSLCIICTLVLIYTIDNLCLYQVLIQP